MDSYSLPPLSVFAHVNSFAPLDPDYELACPGERTRQVVGERLVDYEDPGFSSDEQWHPDTFRYRRYAAAEAIDGARNKGSKELLELWKERLFESLEAEEWSRARSLMKNAGNYVSRFEAEDVAGALTAAQLGVFLVQINKCPKLVFECLEAWFEDKDDASLKELLFGLELGCNLLKCFDDLTAIKYLGKHFSFSHCFDLTHGRMRPVFIPTKLRSIRDILLSYAAEGEIKLSPLKEFKRLSTPSKEQLSVMYTFASDLEMVSTKALLDGSGYLPYLVSRKDSAGGLGDIVNSLLVQFELDDVARIIALGLSDHLPALVFLLDSIALGDEFNLRCLYHLHAICEATADDGDSDDAEEVSERLAKRLVRSINCVLAWMSGAERYGFYSVKRSIAKYFNGEVTPMFISEQGKIPDLRSLFSEEAVDGVRPVKWHDVSSVPSWHPNGKVPDLKSLFSEEQEDGLRNIEWHGKVPCPESLISEEYLDFLREHCKPCSKRDYLSLAAKELFDIEEHSPSWAKEENGLDSVSQLAMNHFGYRSDRNQEQVSLQAHRGSHSSTEYFTCEEGLSTTEKSESISTNDGEKGPCGLHGPQELVDIFQSLCSVPISSLFTSSEDPYLTGSLLQRPLENPFENVFGLNAKSYGQVGLKTVNQMRRAVNGSELRLICKDPQEWLFSFKAEGSIEKERIEELLALEEYEHWQPSEPAQTDKGWVVGMKPKPESSWSTFQRW